MAQGKIKKWNADRGFGFIQPDGGGADVFVHASAFEKAGLDAPQEGDRIAYDVETDQKSGKPAAANVKRA
jgi:CspA family cold shock protein